MLLPGPSYHARAETSEMGNQVNSPPVSSRVRYFTSPLGKPQRHHLLPAVSPTGGAAIPCRACTEGPEPTQHRVYSGVDTCPSYDLVPVRFRAGPLCPSRGPCSMLCSSEGFLNTKYLWSLLPCVWSLCISGTSEPSSQETSGSLSWPLHYFLWSL